MELYHAVHVVGPEDGPSFASMFAKAKCHKAQDGVQDADLVVFTGGAVDVHPMMYGADMHQIHENVYHENMYCVDTMLQYIDVWQECVYTGTPMIGICLGAQFLHVMNGGELYQDVDNHEKDHALHCGRTGELIENISSSHHQMCVDNKKVDVIGCSYESNERWFDRINCQLVIDKPDMADIEAFWYRDTLSLGFQGHPEYQGYPEYTQWFLETVNHYIVENPDLGYVDNKLRMRQKVLEKRKFQMPESVHNFIKEYR